MVRWLPMVLLVLTVGQRTSSDPTEDCIERYVRPVSPVLSLLGYSSKKNLYDPVDPSGILQALPPPILSEYDYIVVGSGSSGSVVSARLAEAGAEVLVLEAGTDSTSWTDVPAASPEAEGSSIDWQLFTSPSNKYCLARKGVCSWHQGKVVGGTSRINHMIYMRGDKMDYDYWERRGNPGWGWDDVLPFFKKSEDQLNPEYAKDSSHSVGGPLPVSDSAYKTPLAEAFLDAGRSLGYPVHDYNRGNSTGFFSFQYTIKDGKRFGTNKAFLLPALKKALKLTVITEATVEKILWDVGPHALGPRAVGVVVNRRGVRLVVRARREVVLSAGVVGSAKILLLSGVGPRRDLAKLGIGLVKDLPVGKAMQSPMGVPIIFTVDKPVSFNVPRLLRDPSNIMDYLRDGTGPYAANDGTECSAMFRTGIDQPADWPDAQALLHSSLGRLESISHSLAQQDGFMLIANLQHPHSRGTISLRSRDPADPPIIKPNYFSDPRDMAAMLRTINFTLAIGQADSFKFYGATFLDLGLCKEHTAFSNTYWECIARMMGSPLYHDACSCPMGRVSDRVAVVDSRLRVHGVQGLRVADASVMPTMMTGHNNAPCIMIGEKAAELLKEDNHHHHHYHH